MKSFAFAYLCLAVTLAPAAFAEKGAVMQLSEATIDYGLVEEGSNPFRTVSLRNVGVAPLIILNVQSNCGCVVVTAPQETIMPGASAQLQVRYDTNRTGAFQKRVLFATNEKSGGQEHLLTLIGTVKKRESGSEVLEGGLTFPE